MSLRARLLIGLVALTAIGLTAAAVATYAEQRSFLLRRVDQEVVASELPVLVRLGATGILSLPSPTGSTVPRLPGATRHGRVPGGGAVTSQESGTYGLLVGANGSVLKSRAFTYGETAASPPALGRGLPISRLGSASVHTFTVDSRAGSSLQYRAAAFKLRGGRVMVVAVPLREVYQTLHQLVVDETLFGVGVILGLIALGWVMIQIGLRPLVRMGTVADAIAHGDLSRRVTPASARTEVGRLGVSLNEMLGQIEKAFAASQKAHADSAESADRLRRFLADASHELRTPLASIRGYAELFRLGASKDPATLRRAMERIESETARMGFLVEDLLTLASLDELPEPVLERVDLRALATQSADDTKAIAPDRTVQVSAYGHPWVLGNPQQLRQVLANLTRNAVIHTPAGSPIELAVYEEQGSAVLEVRDHGTGLPAGAEKQVFDRFWRSEGGRRRGRGGAGLGLAIVKEIVEVHHGHVSACNAPDGGAVFRLTIPAIATRPTERTDSRTGALLRAPTTE